MKASQLPIPKKVLKQHIIALGKTGSGKSSALRVLVEYLLDKKKPVIIIDPKGDWYGLKSSASGKRAGYPIVIFGGKHADVPLSPYSGKAVAELLATGNRSAIIDMQGWMPGERTRFYIDFISTFFNKHRGEHYLVEDEVHHFAPKGKLLGGEAPKMLHWSERIVNEGRGLGITVLAASQRPQKVHNNFLTACETLIGMRVIHKADRDAIEDWIAGAGDEEKGQEVIKTIAMMKRGTGWVWSPEINFGPQIVHFPKFKTYDSFAPQKNSNRRLKGWADVKLSEVTKKLETFVKEAEENDVVLLKEKIRQLAIALSIERQKQKKEEAAKPEPKLAKMTERDRKTMYKEVFAEAFPIVRKELEAAWKDEKAVYRGALTALRNAVEHFATNMTLETKKLVDMNIRAVKGLESTEVPTLTKSEIKAVAEKARHIPGAANEYPFTASYVGTFKRDLPAVSGMPVKKAVDKTDKPDRVEDQKLEPGALRVLKAIAQYGKAGAEKIKVLTGYRATSVREYTRKLRLAGFIEGGDEVTATSFGIAALGSKLEPLPTGEKLLDHWSEKLSGGEKKLYDILRYAIHGKSRWVENETLQTESGLKATSVREYLRLLKARGIAMSGPGGAAALSDNLVAA